MTRMFSNTSENTLADHRSYPLFKGIKPLYARCSVIQISRAFEGRSVTFSLYAAGLPLLSDVVCVSTARSSLANYKNVEFARLRDEDGHLRAPKGLLSHRTTDDECIMMPLIFDYLLRPNDSPASSTSNDMPLRASADPGVSNRTVPKHLSWDLESFCVSTLS